MTNMDIKAIRIFESNFVLYLLNGIADENQEISSSCRNFLEEHGRRMKDALQQLGEDVDMLSANWNFNSKFKFTLFSFCIFRRIFTKFYPGNFWKLNHNIAIEVCILY